MTDLPERDLRTLWHPFTQMSDWMDGRPVVIERGEGNYLIDSEGQRYLDGISSMWVNLHGHDHPRIRAAIHNQLDRLAHSTLLGLANAPSIELAQACEDEKRSAMLPLTTQSNTTKLLNMGCTSFRSNRVRTAGKPWSAAMSCCSDGTLKSTRCKSVMPAETSVS